MAKRAGRPKKDDGDQETTHTRVFKDLAEMIRWIVRVEGGSSAQLLDPLIRTPIAARYSKIEHLVAGIKAAEAKAEESIKRRRGRESD